MTKITDLVQEQARIATQARAKFDEIKTDTPEARATEIEREFDAMMADHSKIGERIERMKRLEAAERLSNLGDDRRPHGQDGDQRGQERSATPEYRNLFARAICGGIEDFTTEERQILRHGAVTGREVRAQVVGTNSAGGFTAPTELMNEIDKAMALWGPMYDSDICRVISTANGNSMKLPTVDDTAGRAAAHTEAGAVTDDGGSDITLGQKSLDAFSYDTEWLRWSFELDMDSIFNFESLLGELLGERMGRTANEQLTKGTGSSAPNGIVTASGLGKTVASASAITADEILDFVHSVNSAYRQSPKARAMFNDSTLLALRKLKDGDGKYLITEAADGEGRLRVGAVSVPYSINEAMDGLAAAKKVMVFGDFGKYFVRKVGRPVLFTARERFAPDMGILGLIRFDGELSNTAAVKHLITAGS
jgi:HK97 family phage major capsid protein